MVNNNKMSVTSIIPQLHACKPLIDQIEQKILNDVVKPYMKVPGRLPERRLKFGIKFVGGTHENGNFEARVLIFELGPELCAALRRPPKSEIRVTEIDDELTKCSIVLPQLSREALTEIANDVQGAITEIVLTDSDIQDRDADDN